MIERYETYEAIRARNQGEGYLHAGTKSFYSRDTRVIGLADRVVARLLQYNEVDCGAYTNRQRIW